MSIVLGTQHRLIGRSRVFIMSDVSLIFFAVVVVVVFRFVFFRQLVIPHCVNVHPKFPPGEMSVHALCFKPADRRDECTPCVFKPADRREECTPCVLNQQTGERSARLVF